MTTAAAPTSGADAMEDVLHVAAPATASSSEPEATPDGQWRFEVGPSAILGSGAHGTVRVARHVSTGEYVAVKVMPSAGIASLVKELTAYSRLNHPNICKLKGTQVDTERQLVYMVMELCSGGELFDRIAECGKLDEEVARRYFWQMASALAHCHERSVYHRDLKPENMLLDASDAVKIADFGLAAVVTQHQQRSSGAGAGAAGGSSGAGGGGSSSGGAGASGSSRSGGGGGGASEPAAAAAAPAAAGASAAGASPSGSPLRGCASRVRDDQSYLQHTKCGSVMYAAPEVLRSTLQRGYDAAAADVWSLGVILFAMLSGTLPFQVAAAGKCARFAIVAQHGLAPLCAAHDFSKAALDVLVAALDPQPSRRRKLPDILASEWLSGMSPLVPAPRLKAGGAAAAGGPSSAAGHKRKAEEAPPSGGVPRRVSGGASSLPSIAEAAHEGGGGPSAVGDVGFPPGAAPAATDERKLSDPSTYEAGMSGSLSSGAGDDDAAEAAAAAPAGGGGGGGSGGGGGPRDSTEENRVSMVRDVATALDELGVPYSIVHGELSLHPTAAAAAGSGSASGSATATPRAPPDPNPEPPEPT